MAPLATEPAQVLLVLNIAKRRALYSLIVEITQWMRSQIELRSESEDFIGSGTGSRYSQELIRLRSAALAHFDAWRREVLPGLKEVLSTPDDGKIVDERRKRTERMAQRKAEQPAVGENLIDFDEPGSSAGVEQAKKELESEIARLQVSYHPIPTRLSTLPKEDREETLSCILLMLLSGGKYAAESRVLVVYLTSALGLPLSVLNREEIEVAAFLVEKSAEASKQPSNPAISADTEAQARKQENQAGRFFKVGLASVAGAALIGVTGGLAAPVVAGAIGGLMGTVGLGGVASVLGIFFMNPVLVGGLFGAYGARMTGEMVDQYAKEVEDFKFIPLSAQWGPEYSNRERVERRLRLTIGINGWLVDKDDVVKPWRLVGADSEVFALRYEMKSLLGLGTSLQELVTSYAWNTVKVEILKRTVLATLWSALWPVHLLSMASSIDNPFSLAKNRSEKAGKILADALINRVQGQRPVTLVGFSLGARVIYSCLRSLVERRAFGLIDSVVFIGAPIPSNKDHWMMMRSVVSGKMFNVFSENDYLLGFLYRATSVQLGVAGLQEIKGIEGVENLNLSEEVSGHMRYPQLIGKILARCGLPTAEGAATGPIEHEEDTILLRDEDRGKTGTLIELDVLHAPKPINHSKQETTASNPPISPPRPEQRKQRTTVVRAATSGLSSSRDPLGVMTDPLSIPEVPPPQYTRSVSAPAVPPPHYHPSLPLRTQLPSSTEPGSSTDKSLRNDEPNVKYSGTGREMALFPKPTDTASQDVSAYDANRGSLSDPSVTWKSFHSPIPDRHDEDDEDDDGGFRIQMVDNDSDQGEFTYVDPTPIED